MKKVRLVAPRILKHGDVDYDKPRESYSKNFKNGENAVKWALTVYNQIIEHCGNGWPIKITVDGVECVHIEHVEYMF